MSYSDLKKAAPVPGMPSTVDPAHQYIFKSGEYGSLFQYWYRDRLGNYVKYTNAPPDHPDYDPVVGQPLMDPEQPVPSKNPEFFTQEGYKRSLAPIEGAEPTRNPSYNQKDASNVWFEVMQGPTGTQYIYLDADVKENLDLYVQNQLRVVDAALPNMRAYATQLFTGSHIKDKLTGAVMMLIDQAFYSIEDLSNATVGDVSFVDQAVILLGRKFICDMNFYDFMTSISAGRSPDEPLFVVDTIHGKNSLGTNYLYAVFAAMRVSPKFLLYWNASHLFSRIVNRMHVEQRPVEDVEVAAFDELARVLTTRDDVKYLVDYKLRVTLLRNYGAGMIKSIQHLITDDFGIAVVRSDLSSLRQDEKEFSDWLHQEPMHDSSPAEEAQISDGLEAKKQEELQQQSQPQPGAASPEDMKEAAPSEEGP